MKKNLLLTSLLLLAIKAFAQTPDSTFKISGNISKLDKGMLYISYQGINKYIVDSSKIINGNFEFSGKIAQPEIAYLKLVNTQMLDNNTPYVYLEPKLMQVQLSNNPFAVVTVKGSKTHDELMEWKTANNSLKQKFSGALSRLDTETDTAKHKLLQDSMVLYYDQKFAVEYDFIKSHPQSYFSPYLLVLHYRNYTVAQLNEIYNKFGSQLQTSVNGKLLLKDINSMSADSRGTIAANITGKDYVNNEDFDLSKLKGKYVIIDFWGSWCVPCIKLIPAIAAEHEKYKDKNIAFVSVAYDQDGNQNKCRELVKQLRMSWVNLWQTQGKPTDPGITNTFDVGVFPTIILIDPQGKILERGDAEYGFLKCKAVLEKVFGNSL